MNQLMALSLSPSPPDGHVGSFGRLVILLLVFVVYLNVGAMVFSYTERHTASERRNAFNLYIDDFKERNSRGDSLNASELETFISRMEEFVLSGSHDNQTGDRWDFIGSFFFSATVVTTIGYGRTFPHTRLGINLCIVYALFGIPLTAYLLTEIRDIFRRCAIVLVRKVHFLVAYVMKNKRVTMVVKWCLVTAVVYSVIIGIPAIGISYMEGWNYEDAHYFCFISLSTIGFGDKVAGPSQHRGNYRGDWVNILYTLVVVVYLISGLGVIAVFINLFQSGDHIYEESGINLIGDYDAST